MPHVSKHKLNQNLYQKLFSELIELQTGLSQKQATNFIKSLLTETEQLMLTKRCAAAIMFAEGYSNYKVWQTLKVSSSTVVRLREQYDEGEFNGLLRGLRNKKLSKKDKEEFAEALGKVLRLGMPSMGKDRWKALKW